MTNKPLTLSIVIPVYNEEYHLKNCLEAIAAQTIKPLEVIVVDNNCSDRSMHIARSYNFVKIIKEPRQGRGYARSKGFDEAHGDIIGRIDADSVVMKTWVERVLIDFKEKNIMGLTGLGLTHSLPLRAIPNLHTTIWSRAYFWSTFADIRLQTMWGANMAIRRSAWLKIRSQACLDDEIVHEDIDISLLMQAKGLKIKKDNKLLIKTRGTSYNYLPKMMHYFNLRFSTRKFRKDLLYSTNPPIHLIGFWRVQFYRLMSLLPGLAFIILSVLNWPLDYFMIKIRHTDHWLD